MTVLMCPQWIHAVINMKYCNLIKAYNLIEFFKHFVIMIDYIIACIIHMACIKTYPQSVSFFNTIVYCF